MPPTNSLVAVVLAAGKGKRLKSAVPKVLHPLCGRPALWWVLQDVRAARPSKIVIVVHHGADEVREAVRIVGGRPRARVRGAGRGARDRSRGPRGREGGRSRVRGADRERGLRPRRARGRPHADPRPPADQGRRHDDHHRGGASRQLLAHRPRRRPARLDRRGERRAGLDAFDPRGGDQLDRLPSRGPVPRAPARRPRELAGRALPERRLPDPDREGRTRVGPAGRHRRGDGDQLARRPGKDRARPARTDQRAASGERRDPRGSRDDLHRRGRPDRPRHRDPPDDVPVGRDADREGLRDRTGDAGRRHLGRRGRGPSSSRS